MTGVVDAASERVRAVSMENLLLKQSSWGCLRLLRNIERTLVYQFT